MPKEVKISYKLFQELCKYHLGDQDWSDIHYIKRELSDKLQRMVDREQYRSTLFTDKSADVTPAQHLTNKE